MLGSSFQKALGCHTGDAWRSCGQAMMAHIPNWIFPVVSHSLPASQMYPPTPSYLPPSFSHFLILFASQMNKQLVMLAAPQLDHFNKTLNGLSWVTFKWCFLGGKAVYLILLAAHMDLKSPSLSLQLPQFPCSSLQTCCLLSPENTALSQLGIRGGVHIKSSHKVSKSQSRRAEPSCARKTFRRDFFFLHS